MSFLADIQFNDLYSTLYFVLLAFVSHFTEYLVIAGIAFVVFYVLFPKFFSKNKIQPKHAKRSDYIREFLHSAQTSLIIAAVSLAMIFTDLVQFTQVYFDREAYPSWWFPVSIVLALIVHDTYFYWMHRSVHHPKLYKKVHYLHHKSINPTPWAAYSFHFYEGCLEAFIAVIVLLLIPMHPLALVGFGMSSLAINAYGHLGYEIFPKYFRTTFLFQIFNTSVHHNLHHATFNHNFGLYFRFWDRIMGTEHPDYVKEYDKVQEKRFGEKPNDQAVKAN